MKRKALKIWGIILLVAQAISTIVGAMSGEFAEMFNQPPVLALAGFLGYFAMGIVGIILIIKYNQANKEESLDEENSNKNK